MSNVEKLVETFIEATEEKRMSWRNPSVTEKAMIESKVPSNMGIYILSSNDEEMVAIVKYVVSDKPWAPPSDDTVYTEKVSLLILNTTKNQIVTQIDEVELGVSHRLWTLYKLADRSEKGADKIIDNLIDKYKKFLF